MNAARSQVNKSFWRQHGLTVYGGKPVHEPVCVVHRLSHRTHTPSLTSRLLMPRKLWIRTLVILMGNAPILGGIHAEAELFHWWPRARGKNAGRVPS